MKESEIKEKRRYEMNAVKQHEISKKRIGRPFQKGQSGNPRGRPKRGQAVTEILRELSSECAAGNKTRAEAVAMLLWEMALNGDGKAIQFIIERLEGKAKQTIDTNAQGVTLVFRDPTSEEIAEARGEPCAL